MKNNYLSFLEYKPTISEDLLPSRNIDYNYIEDDEYVVCYISDLHLDYKVGGMNKRQTIKCLKEIINQLFNSIPKSNNQYKIIIAGDVSFNFNIYKQFFYLYVDTLKRLHFSSHFFQTFVVLGNHELWDLKLNKECRTLNQLFQEYKDFFERLKNEHGANIYLLENELYVINDDDKKYIYSAQDIMSEDFNELKEHFKRNRFTIFGGLGYAGLNDEFNCLNDIYKSKLIVREQEKYLSYTIDYLHKKLTNIFDNKEIFFVTHTPMKDWSQSKYNKNWVYINGHTHKNYYEINDTKKLYADNQIGYDGNNFSFKTILTKKTYNIFDNYKDGIYEITRNMYKSFYQGLGHYFMEFNRKFYKLYMVKRNNTYCFLIQLKAKDPFKLLEGGIPRNAGNHDLLYYYNALDNYVKSIKLFMNQYNNYEKIISKEIQAIGGIGSIHGSIIDIDFYNHIFVNINGKLTPYYALDIIEKYEYPNIISLLKYHNQLLYKNYVKMIENNSQSNIVKAADVKEIKKAVLVEDTSMYKISRIFKALQYTTNNNIVRIWNDEFVNNVSEENGKNIIMGLLNYNKKT